MATFVKRKGPDGRWVWQVRVRKRGYPQRTHTFSLKANAEAWAQRVERGIESDAATGVAEAEATTLAEALDRYEAEFSSKKRSATRERRRIDLWRRHSLATRFLTVIRGKNIAEFVREREAEGAGPNTIRLDLALLSHLYTVARSAWGMESLQNPVQIVRGSRPKLPRGRDRRLLPGEEDRLLTACRFYGGVIEFIVAIAIETAMRRGEIASMRWEHLDRQARVLRVPETKTGVPRQVPLSSRALAVLDALPRRIDGYVWGIRADGISQAFVRVVKRARARYEAECAAAGKNPDPRMLRDLRFHDLRHEATSRLFERGLNPMQVAAITGHKTLQMLKRYTHLRAEDLVDLLG